MPRPPALSFDKYEGLGNDFVLVRSADERDVSTSWARAVCDRRRGVGGDGVLVMLPPATAGAEARMRVINADGSIAEMCGNGLRCAALYLAQSRGIDEGEIAIETDAGLRRCLIQRRGEEAVVLADMGVVRLLEDVIVDLDGEPLALTRVDAGNPHAVSLRSVTQAEFERLGPALSVAPAFPHGTNVEFVRIDPISRAVEVLVWERGAGATLACGTGACAAVVAARAKDAISGDGSVVVRLPGGELQVTVDRMTGAATLRGPARRVFAGRFAGGAA